jgi:hypothetical protein
VVMKFRIRKIFTKPRVYDTKLRKSGLEFRKILQCEISSTCSSDELRVFIGAQEDLPRIKSLFGIQKRHI